MDGCLALFDSLSINLQVMGHKRKLDTADARDAKKKVSCVKIYIMYTLIELSLEGYPGTYTETSGFYWVLYTSKKPKKPPQI